MNKVAIVTGASRGIGKEIAKYLARENITVIADYNQTSATKLQDELLKEGHYVDIFKADVSKHEDIKALVKYTLEKYKRIDILVNNAGISQYGLITEQMVDQKSGCIINISSIWGQVGAAMESVYAVTKAGIDALTKSMAKELGPSGIRVNSIAPGIIATDMNSGWTK